MNLYFTNHENINIISNIFEQNNCAQILVQNFDVLDDYKLEKNFLFNNNYKFTRWDYDDTIKNPIWNHRVNHFLYPNF